MESCYSKRMDECFEEKGLDEHGLWGEYAKQ